MLKRNSFRRFRIRSMELELQWSLRRIKRILFSKHFLPGDLMEPINRVQMFRCFVHTNAHRIKLFSRFTSSHRHTIRRQLVHKWLERL